jgi:transposase
LRNGALAARELLPREHFVDTTYVTADHLVTSRDDHGIDLVGPVGRDQSWQARQNTGYAIAQFAIDWERQQATCPRRKTSVIWNPTTDSQEHPVVSIRFAPADCTPCPVRHVCVGHDRPRVLMVRVQPRFEALMAVRQRQTTEEFKARDARRAGIAGTISQGVQVCDLRRRRYRGLSKTALGHVFIATALNFIRMAA